MRILVITDISGYMRGGVPTETRSLINGLLERGHAVGLIADVPISDTPPILHFPLTLPIDASFAAQVGSALTDFEPDFVHVMCMSSKGILALAPVLSKTSWALTVHSVPPYERKLNRWHGVEALHYGARALRFLINTLAWKWIFRRDAIPTIIVHSEFVQDVVIDYSANASRVCLIPLPFEGSIRGETEDFIPAIGETPLLVTVAGFAHTKGQHDVLKALPGLLRLFPGIRYQMIGEVRDPSYLNYLWDLAEKYGIKDKVTVSPDLDQASKLSALRAADIYIQPSHEEGFCLAFAEAAGIVARLVGTDAGAIRAMSDGDPGARIVPPKNPSAIGDAVNELLLAELPKTLMRTRSDRLKRDFSLENYLSQHERIYSGTGALP